MDADTPELFMSTLRDLAQTLCLPSASTEGDAMVALSLATTPPIKKGDRVTTSGAGRTADWSATTAGTVSRVSAGRIFVRWDGTSIGEDEMSVEEVARAV